MAVSANGAVVFGERDGFLFRWTAGTGFQNLVTTPGLSVQSVASDAAGRVVVGRVSDGSRTAFRWTTTDGFVVLVPRDSESDATGVSDDASVSVGFARTASGRRALRWGASIIAEDLPLGDLTDTHADAVSGDGSVIVGGSAQGIWMKTGADEPRLLMDVLEELGVDVDNLPVQPSAVVDVSGDGTVLVGTGTNPTTSTTQSWVARVGAP